jgi:hypothetical protein
VGQIKSAIQDREGIPVDIQRLTYQTKELRDSSQNLFKRTGSCDVTPIFTLSLCLLGGKGGFGALLRGAGSKGKKTTNFDDCRDLNGRRIRHVKNEQKLVEWYQQQKQEELEKKNRKATPKEEPKHFFDSATYSKELEEIDEEISNAVKEGLKKEKEKQAEMKKRKAKEEKSNNENKKRIAW